MLTALNQHINIRQAIEEDMESISSIYNQSIDLGFVTADTEYTNASQRKEIWLTITKKQNRPFWVAVEEKKVIAFFYFRNFYDRPAYRITAEIGIYIDNNYHSKGIGKLILNYCISQAPNLGIENILALIFASNKNSITMFEKAGFLRNGEFKKLAKSSKGYNDLIILQKEI